MQTTLLTHLGLLQVQGTDAEKLLQGQATNDFAHHPDDHYQFGAACTPKGRAYCNYLSIKTGQGFLLLMSGDIVDTTLARLNKYAVFYKVELINVTDQYQILGVTGSDLADPHTLISVDDGYRLFWPGQREIRIIPSNTNVQITEQDDTEWRTQDILQGLPWITSDSVDEHIPQNLNLHALDGISFSKGCYTGQEIVARLQYKGKLKSWSVPAQVDHQIAPNTRLLNEHGRAVGQVLNSTNRAALVVIKQSALDQPVVTDESNQQTLKFENLPYTLDKGLQN